VDGPRTPSSAPAAAGRPGTRCRLAGDLEIRWTGRPEGDLRGSSEEAEMRRQAVCPLPWTRLHQVHGSRVVLVEDPGDGCGEAADAAVTMRAGVALAVLCADCAPVVLSSPDGVFGVAHAGWRGLRDGIVEATVGVMRGLGATDVEAALGPCIRPECFEFGTVELAEMERRFGRRVARRHRSGAPALDLPAAVRAALELAGVPLVADAGVCTGCSDNHWSWRVGRDAERQAAVAWRS
jgi:YfiH family protein